jgi:hypothetical protein
LKQIGVRSVNRTWPRYRPATPREEDGSPRPQTLLARDQLDERFLVERFVLLPADRLRFAPPVFEEPPDFAPLAAADLRFDVALVPVLRAPEVLARLLEAPALLLDVLLVREVVLFPAEVLRLPAVLFFAVLLRLPAVPLFAVLVRLRAVPVRLRAAAWPPFRPPLRAGSLFSAMPRPEPDFLPPPSDLLTVAQARRSASFSLSPRFS